MESPPGARYQVWKAFEEAKAPAEKTYDETIVEVWKTYEKTYEKAVQCEKEVK